MKYAQYNRLGLHVSATVREVVKAAHGRLSAKGKTRALRDGRHQFLRDMLAEHSKARGVYRQVMGGRS